MGKILSKFPQSQQDKSYRDYVRGLLKKYKISPLKRLGQNFLIDEKVLRKIIEAAELSKNDIVLEVGPGIGNLTAELAKRVHPVKSAKGGASQKQFNRVKKVIAIEKDPNLVRILNNELRIKNIKNVKIIRGDILKINLKPYTSKPYKVVANIPYYLTSPLIRKFLENTGVQPLQMVLMVQKEVAQRICANPPKMSILAVSVQFYAKPEIISLVSKKSFWPSPKVDSAIIKIIPRKSALPIRVNPLLFFKIVKAGFSQPRKQLINNFSKSFQCDKKKVERWLLKNKIRPTQRAETLKLGDWINLTKSFKIILER